LALTVLRARIYVLPLHGLHIGVSNEEPCAVYIIVGRVDNKLRGRRPAIRSLQMLPFVELCARFIDDGDPAVARADSRMTTQHENPGAGSRSLVFAAEELEEAVKTAIRANLDDLCRSWHVLEDFAEIMNTETIRLSRV